MTLKPPTAGNSPIVVGNILNVQNYGARGDGTTNDTAAITSAVSACSAQGGGILFFPQGTYKVTSAITVPNFVSLQGTGQSSIITAAGNHFCLNLNPANRVEISNLSFTAASTQSSGGAIDFTLAGSNIKITDLYLGSNLFYGLNISPDSPAGIYWIDRIRWNVVSGCNTGIRIGGGAGLVTDIYMGHLVGTAATNAGMVRWIWMLSPSDTLKVSDSLFYQGTNGILLGTDAQVTNITMTAVTVDSMSGVGFQIQNIREAKFIGCEVSTCASANNPGIDIMSGAKGARWIGGVIQNCLGYGVIIRSGATHTRISDAIVSDNNTSNTAFNDGIAVGANATSFAITNNTSGNSVILAGGHQKNGISVAVGTSDHYVITGNTLTGNDSSNAVVDGGTGVNKTITGNIT